MRKTLITGKNKTKGAVNVAAPFSIIFDPRIRPQEYNLPEINYKDANIIHFTKEKNNGRYGFLLDVAD